ncbi:MAG: DUF1559 domain-containing protein [Fimbriimonadales bacterium]
MNRRQEFGFTLVELLVVCAILSVLAAILFPVVRTATAAARNRQCLNNFAQVGAALALYQGDYDDTVPPVNYRKANVNNSEEDRSWVQTLLPYAGDFALFQCPSDTGRLGITERSKVSIGGWKNYYSASLRSNLGYNFLYLSPLIEDQSGNWSAYPVSGSQIANESLTIAFIDSVWDRSVTGQPYGGGSWVVVPPCRYIDTPSGPYDTFGIPGNSRSYFGFNPPGWQPSSSTSWLVYGGAWPWHRNRFTILYADGRAASVSLPLLVQGCEFAPQWRGRIQSTADYLWDLQD